MIPTPFTQNNTTDLSLKTLTTEQQDQFLFELGKESFDTALMYLLDTLSESQQSALIHAIEVHDSFPAIVAQIELSYPLFKELLADEQEHLAESMLQGSQ